MRIEDFKTGIYQHFKGKKYIVLGLARHSETLDWLVIYIPLYENENAKMWVRPFEMFVEEVEVGDKLLPRFKYISSI